MATWKDGAAYAPVERPDGFATPVADPLPAGAPYQPGTPGPMTHPSGFAPLPPQPPLGQLGREQVGERDPRDAFTVASSLVTADPSHGREGGRDPRQPFPTTAQSALDTAPPPPVGAPLEEAPPIADRPATPHAGQPINWPAPQVNPSSAPMATGAYPPPRVPAQYPGGPPARRAAPVDPTTRTLARVAAGLCLLGFFAAGSAGFALLVAGLIGLRTKHLTKALGNMTLSAGVAGLLLQFTLRPYVWAQYSGAWSLIALGCGIGFLVYSLRTS